MRKNFNVVNFEYSSEALDQKLLRKVMLKIDPGYCNKFEEMIKTIRDLEAIVAERKEKVLIFFFFLRNVYKKTKFWGLVKQGPCTLRAIR